VAHVSAANETAGATTAPVATIRAPPKLARVRASTLARRFAGRLRTAWLPQVAWIIGRTGRPGLVGIALLLAAAVFLFSTHREVAAEVEALRAELPTASGKVSPAAADRIDAHPVVRALPARTEMPAILRKLFDHAVKARLAIDTGRYEIRETRRGGVVRTHVTFPVTGPYPKIRTFIDTTLATMPAVALGELALERRSIGDGVVEAQIGMIVYTAEAARAPSTAPQLEPVPASATLPASERVVTSSCAAALFAQHTWAVLAPLPKLPPPPPPPPPPEPTAPPLPFVMIGSYAPAGEQPVFILSRADQVISAKVGDRLDDAYKLESAAGGELVFVYLPLDIRQSLSLGASR
jgi:Tfp pilus assembly protein PilO